MLGHKMSLNTFKKTETTSVLFSDRSTLRLDAENKKKLKTQTVGLSGGWANAAEQLIGPWRNHRGDKKNI